METNGESTSAEIAILELKKEVQDLAEENKLLNDDLYLLRWLKARGMDVEKAARMIRASHHWRNTWLKETLKATLDPALIEIFSENVHKSFCKDGSQVEFIDTGKIDIPYICKRFGKVQLDKYLCEEALAAEQLNILWNKKVFEQNNCKIITEESITGCVHVYNDMNITLKQATSLTTLKYVKQMSTHLRKYFPCHVRRIVVINCPTFAMYVLNAIKPLIEGKHVAIECYNHEKAIWTQALLQHVLYENLAREYGGNMKIGWQNKWRNADLLRHWLSQNISNCNSTEETTST